MKHACTLILLFTLFLAGSLPAAAQREADAARMYAWDRLTTETFNPDTSALILTQDEDGTVNVATVSAVRNSAVEPTVVGTLEIVERVPLDTTVRHGAPIFNSATGVGFDLVASTLRPMAGGEIYLLGVITSVSNKDLRGDAATAVSILMPLQIEDSLALVRRAVGNLTEYEIKAPAAYEPAQSHNGDATRCGPEANCRLNCRVERSSDGRQCLLDLGLDLSGPAGAILICGSSCPVSGPLAPICLIGCGLIIGTETYEAFRDLFACDSTATNSESDCFATCSPAEE